MRKRKPFEGSGPGIPTMFTNVSPNRPADVAKYTVTIGSKTLYNGDDKTVAEKKMTTAQKRFDAWSCGKYRGATDKC